MLSEVVSLAITFTMKPTNCTKRDRITLRHDPKSILLYLEPTLHRTNRVGGAASPDLSHHRTYRSVYGGSIA